MGFDGHLHERDSKIAIRITIPLAIFVACFSVVWIGLLQIAIGMIIGSFSGFAVTPDADHLAMTREEYRAMKRWGLFGVLLVAYMTPYAYLIPHRSKLSHTIFPGTLIRMAYMSIIPTLLIIVSMKWLNIDTFPYWLYIGLFFGWAAQDSLHYIRDGIGPFGTDRKRRVRW